MGERRRCLLTVDARVALPPGLKDVVAASRPVSAEKFDANVEKATEPNHALERVLAGKPLPLESAPT
jgi:hypothetical protein